jgi:hypothetical protein
MYQFYICNHFIDFDSLESLNKSQVDANMGYWLYEIFDPFPSHRNLISFFPTYYYICSK